MSPLAERQARLGQSRVDLPAACLEGPHGDAVRHLAACDPRLAPWIARAGACLLPPPSRPDAAHLFDGLVHAVVSQQLSGKAADTIVGRVRALGEGGQVPSPARLAALDDAALRAAGLSGAKTASVKDLAARVVSGALRLSELADLEDEAVVAELVAVRGIGRWTAQMALMFRFGRPDVLPVADLGVRKGAMRLTGRRELPEADRLERIARPWRPFRSVASWYLWRVAEARDAG